MYRQLLPITALLLGSGLLLFAGGVNSLILPVRGSAEGFSASALGLLGTGWAVGYVLGCVYVPRLVASVGHIRTFGVLCALAAIAILLQSMVVQPWFWVPVRAVSGFCFAGAAMIVESWLSDRADPANRGRIFGIYSMVNLVAITAGQMVIAFGDVTGFFFFALGAIFYCCALIPTAISTSQSPAPLTTINLNIPALWRNSPVAVAAAFLIGISNASFGTLAAVYADNIGLALASIALFASVPVLAGAASQVPVGYLSDRLDRRKVLAGLALLAVIADLAFVLLAPESQAINLGLVAVFGAAIFAMYPVIIAHANDHAPAGTSIQVSGGLLMVFGIGSIIGPLIAGWAMSAVGAYGLFGTTLLSHLLMVGFTLWRMTKRSAVAADDKGSFQLTMTTRATTPETVAFLVGDEDDEFPEADSREWADR